jgi:hypothetical protein
LQILLILLKMMTRDIILVSAGYDMTIRFWSDFNESKCKHSIEYKDSVNLEN